MSDMLGLINLREYNKPLAELNPVRNLGSSPVAGKYRMIDFVLSNMVNADVGDVGILLSARPTALLDHIRSGKEWNLAKKRDGLFYLPTEQDQVLNPVEGDIRDYSSNLKFIERGNKRYVILSFCNSINNIDYTAVREFHREHKAEVTLVYCKQKNDLVGQNRTIDVDTDQRVVEFSTLKQTQPGDKLFMQVALIESGIFVRMIAKAMSEGKQHFFGDIISKELDKYKVYGYEHKGIAMRIDSVESYFRTNMALLNKDLWRQLFFKPRASVHTKIKDETPTKYGEESEVKRSLVASGCVIEGKLENCIVFRCVHVAKGAVIKNSIIMQHAEIEANANLDCVICDKNAIITSGKSLQGSPEKPICITKGSTI